MIRPPCHLKRVTQTVPGLQLLDAMSDHRFQISLSVFATKDV